MADGTSPVVPAAPAEALTPTGINHLVINVRDIEEAHRFWTEILGFKQVGVSLRRNGKMRFYSGDHGGGRMNHHDIALCENPDLPAPPADWDMFKTPVAVNHIAITDAEPRSVAQAARLSAQQGGQVPSPRQSRDDPQPL